MEHELQRILERGLLSPVYQPVVSINRKMIVGYEALIRGPASSPLHAPIDLFEAARRCGKQGELELACREAVIAGFVALGIPGKLFVNVSPAVLTEPGFAAGETSGFSRHAELDPRAIIIELTEHQPTEDYRLMRAAVDHYRGMGFEIALDDLGAGYSGLRLWSELRPEYVKIDQHFIRLLHDDPVKLSFVRSIQNMATAMHCKVIAEGIETPEEFQAIARIGVTHVQGYYFARPSPQPPTSLDGSLFVRDLAYPVAAELAGSRRVEEICRAVEPVGSDMPIAKVLDLFQMDRELNILPVVDAGNASGLVFRDRFLSMLFSTRYGIELHGRHPIKSFINDTPFSVDKNTPMEQVSRMLTEAMRGDQAFIVSDDGCYLGIATLLDLLEEITRQQVRNARHANPLTLLPGSVPTNECIDRLLDDDRLFGVGYFDLDHFKPYNDVYGYSAGDNIIKLVAELLTLHVPAGTGHVGHIGGDDFIVVFTGDDWLPRCQNVLDAFALRVPEHYRDRDLEVGGVFSEDRHGDRHFFPLISLSVGLVDAQATGQCRSHVDIAELATAAKKQAKKLPGNSFFVNRRQQFSDANTSQGTAVNAHAPRTVNQKKLRQLADHLVVLL